jgi:phosphatidylglycerophosphate synthase
VFIYLFICFSSIYFSSICFIYLFFTIFSIGLGDVVAAMRMVEAEASSTHKNEVECSVLSARLIVVFMSVICLIICLLFFIFILLLYFYLELMYIVIFFISENWNFYDRGVRGGVYHRAYFEYFANELYVRSRIWKKIRNNKRGYFVLENWCRKFKYR